eukprot:3956971-Prymnesium_polylepis.1
MLPFKSSRPDFTALLLESMQAIWLPQRHRSPLAHPLLSLDFSTALELAPPLWRAHLHAASDVQLM